MEGMAEPALARGLHDTPVVCKRLFLGPVCRGPKDMATVDVDHEEDMFSQQGRGQDTAERMWPFPRTRPPEDAGGEPRARRKPTLCPVLPLACF